MLRIYWDETNDNCEECVLKKTCDRGDLDLSCGTGIYLIKDFEEPEQEGLESEYDWKKQRFEYLKRLPYASPGIITEIGHLAIWLAENNPKPKENWEICTKDNTKVGDDVRYRSLGSRIRTVSYIINSRERFIIMDKETGLDRNTVFSMEEFEINTVKVK